MSRVADGKVAVVTGAAQGIGLACARRFAAHGMAMVIADVQDERGEAAAAALRTTRCPCTATWASARTWTRRLPPPSSVSGARTCW